MSKNYNLFKFNPLGIFNILLKLIKIIFLNFNKFEFYFIKSLGWLFILIGLYNIINQTFLFIPIYEMINKKATIESIDLLFNLIFIYVFTPIFLGGILLLKRKE